MRHATSTGTLYTQNRLRNNGEAALADVLFTFDAHTVATVFDKAKSLINALETKLVLLSQRHCHLLGLHRVNAREPANCIIRRNRLGPVFRRRKLLLQLNPKALKH